LNITLSFIKYYQNYMKILTILSQYLMEYQMILKLHQS
jgi:hypothetical protein